MERGDFDELKAKIREKTALGKLIFQTVVVPKAKEIGAGIKDAAEAAMKNVEDILDPDKRFAKGIKAKRDALVEEGFTEKEADDIIAKIVSRTLKETKTKKGGKENE